MGSSPTVATIFMLTPELETGLLVDQLEDEQKISPKFPADVRCFLCTHVQIDGWYNGPKDPAMDWLIEKGLARIVSRKRRIGFGYETGVQLLGRAQDALITYLTARELGQ